MSKQEDINTINKAMAALPTRLSDTRAVRGIDGDVKLNQALYVMAEAMLSGFQS